MVTRWMKWRVRAKSRTSLLRAIRKRRAIALFHVRLNIHSDERIELLRQERGHTQ